MQKNGQNNENKKFLQQLLTSGCGGALPANLIMERKHGKNNR